MEYKKYGRLKEAYERHAKGRKAVLDAEMEDKITACCVRCSLQWMPLAWRCPKSGWGRHRGRFARKCQKRDQRFSSPIIAEIRGQRSNYIPEGEAGNSFSRLIFFARGRKSEGKVTFTMSDFVKEGMEGSCFCQRVLLCQI